MSRSPSPMNTPSPVYSESSESEAAEEEEEKGEEDTATCLWGECGKVFTHLPSLIEHIHVGESPCIRTEKKLNGGQIMSG